MKLPLIEHTNVGPAKLNILHWNYHTPQTLLTFGLQTHPNSCYLWTYQRFPQKTHDWTTNAALHRTLAQHLFNPTYDTCGLTSHSNTKHLTKPSIQIQECLLSLVTPHVQKHGSWQDHPFFLTNGTLRSEKIS